MDKRSPRFANEVDFSLLGKTEVDMNLFTAKEDDGMKYTNGEVQQIIDDLDYAQTFLSPYEEAKPKHPEIDQVLLSLKNASDLLCELPIEVIEALDKKRDIFVQQRK